MLPGEKLDQEALSSEFDKCLLTALEMKRWEHIMEMKKTPEAIQDKLDDVFEGEICLLETSSACS